MNRNHDFGFDPGVIMDGDEKPVPGVEEIVFVPPVPPPEAPPEPPPERPVTPDTPVTTGDLKDLENLLVLSVRVQDELRGRKVDTKELITGGDVSEIDCANRLLKRLKRPSADALVNLGCSYAYLYEFDEAEEAFEKAMAMRGASNEAFEAAQFNLELVLPDLRRRYPSQ